MNAHLYVFLLREADFRGIDPAPLLRQCGLTREGITTFGAGIPSDKGVRLLRLLMDRIGDPAIGLQAGTRAELADLHLPGIMLRASANISSAVGLFTEMMASLGSIYSTQLVLTPDGALVRYLPQLGDATPRAFHDLFLSGAHTLARDILGPFTPLAVRTTQPDDECADEYRRVFGAPVTFSSPWTELKVPASAYERLAHSDSLLVQVIEPYMRQQLAQVHHAPDVISQVRHVLMTDLSSGYTSITSVADRLAVSARTLRRQLQLQGTSFQIILDQTKHEIALQRLRDNPGASGAQIARWLGYAEPPAFYRAFKRWTGVSLTQYQQQEPGPQLAPGAQLAPGQQLAPAN